MDYRQGKHAKSSKTANMRIGAPRHAKKFCPSIRFVSENTARKQALAEGLSCASAVSVVPVAGLAATSVIGADPVFAMLAGVVAVAFCVPSIVVSKVLAGLAKRG